MGIFDKSRKARHATGSGFVGAHGQPKGVNRFSPQQVASIPVENNTSENNKGAVFPKSVGEQLTFAEDQLPEWAIRDEGGSDSLAAFFNAPAEHSRSGAGFVIPRGQSEAAVRTGAASVSADVSATVPEPTPTVQDSTPVVPEPTPIAQIPEIPDAPAVEVSEVRIPESVQVPVTAPSTESAWGTEPVAEPVFEPELVRSNIEASKAIRDDQEGLENLGKQESGEGLENPESDEEQEHVGEETAEKKNPFDALGFGKREKNENDSPRREDFARFRCIYESRDGQLAIYEDEDGHLTAVNTNRFV